MFDLRFEVLQCEVDEQYSFSDVAICCDSSCLKGRSDRIFNCFGKRAIRKGELCSSISLLVFSFKNYEIIFDLNIRKSYKDIFKKEYSLASPSSAN